MAFVYYGVHKAHIGMDEIMERCPACESDTFHEILVTSNYYHMFLIPVFPIAKEVTMVCEKCGMRRKDVPLTQRSFKNYDALREKFRHPWHTYLLPLFIAAVGLYPLIYFLFIKE